MCSTMVNGHCHIETASRSASFYSRDVQEGSLFCVCMHPFDGTQESSVQKFPSLQFIGVPPHTPFDTLVIGCAGITVITGDSAQRLMGTAGFCIAFILRTRVAVVTAYLHARANTIRAYILFCAGIMVITNGPVRRFMNASGLRVTCVLGAGIVIVTTKRCADAGPVLAGIFCCTGIMVIAGDFMHQLMDTSGYLIARVLCALIPVIAIERCSPATPARAGVSCCAGAAVITGYPIQRLMSTAGFGITVILCAVVPVITIDRRSVACPVVAGIACCAGIAVIAGDSAQRLMGTSDHRGAFILGAWVAVITIERGTNAYSVLAGVVRCTSVFITAGEPVFPSRAKIRTFYCYEPKVGNHLSFYRNIRFLISP